MKYEQGKVIIPSWISCHTYLFNTEESRTYISNEKNHSYTLLEGLASDMWKLVYDGISKIELEKWASEKGVFDEVEGFLDELLSQDLITSLKQKDEYKSTVYFKLDEQANGENESIFIDEMQTWLIKNKFMYSLFFELTYRCNLKCVHCYNPKDISSVEISVEECKRIIDDAYELGCFKMTFSGGEATLHGRFLEIIEYARSKHISVEIFTNGQTLAQDETLYEQILSLYPYRICVSLYSVDEKTHEKVTAVEGSFQKTYELISRLREDNVNVQIKNFLLSINCLDCIKVKELAKRIKATSVADISLIPTIEGDKKTLQYMLDEDTLFSLYTDKDSPLFVDVNKIKLIDVESQKENTPCLGGHNGLTITPTGDVVICVSMPLSVGNVYNQSIKDIWQAAMAKNADSKLYQWQCISLKDFKECFKEDYCRFCNICPGMGYLENGYLKRSNVQCIQAKAKMKAYNYLLRK